MSLFEQFLFYSSACISKSPLLPLREITDAFKSINLFVGCHYLDCLSSGLKSR